MVAATMNVAASEEKLLAFIGHLFDECRARGFHEPYYLTILGANGYLIAYQVDHSKAVPATEWAEHPVGPGVQLPATVHAVDPETGRAILARIGPNGDVKAEMTN